MVSNALEKSKYTPIEYFPNCKVFTIWFTADAKAMNVEWNFLKPNWKSYSILNFSINFNKRLYISLSKIFYSTGSIETGLKLLTFIEFPDLNKVFVVVKDIMCARWVHWLILVLQTCRIAVSWYYLRWYCIWVILAKIYMLIKDIISAMWGRQYDILTHWGRVTHICVSKLTIIRSDNGLSPDRRQAIIWTNAGLLLIEPLGTNFSEILIEILTFSFKKMCLKVSSAKRRPFCLGLNVLIRRRFSFSRLAG